MVNIKNILKENGLEIVVEIKMEYFKLKFTEEKLKEMIKKEHLYDYDIRGTFNVKISEMGFNGDGGLYIIFTCTDDEHFDVGDTFELIEY